ncbi:ribulose-phosphate 3-epimerase [Eggerthellaceae bacterium zg-1084]|uniref:Ribulose-phosphate 3-epimerase n=2 Tax=Berryella wangjianweii TaxID=2734634 RepID=A0A6M8IZM0_9ACTN|nr:ribulose-phosphate 3-epimerase [Berryella wangjianweii]NPD31233.1 ribulose-phosphate 3-epimerase [Berryella wangjianweii]NPD32458.1 ribulose-phosphate 3-epimerase [Eggerthellaceae bacterium zg-997]QKF06784.1 ribulose-phosphate 3-epimerase [Berryella wangjianweii]
MFKPLQIAPSILSADFMHLADDIALMERAGAALVHVDVMDGHFVPNLTMGVPIIRQLRKATDLPLDVHLMIENPLRQLDWFLQAGCHVVTVHAETLYGAELDQAVDRIVEAGCLPALALRPRTPVEVLAPVIGRLHMVLVMSVEPGFSGQRYHEGSELKVAAVARMARAVGNHDLLIEVDGGIGPATVGLVAAAGADVMVCGSAFFDAADPARALAEVRERGDAARLAALQGQEGPQGFSGPKGGAACR